MSENAMMTLPVAQYDDMRNQVLARDQRIAELEAQLRAEQVVDPTGRVDKLLEIIRSSIPVIQFAVANLAPETVRGWPRARLRQLGQLLGDMPSATQLDVELGLNLIAFAGEIEAVEAERAGRDEHVPPPVAVEAARKLAVPGTHRGPPPEALDAAAGREHNTDLCGPREDGWYCGCGCAANGVICCKLRNEVTAAAARVAKDPDER